MSFETIETAFETLLKMMDRFKDTYTASTIGFTHSTHKIGDTANGLLFVETGDVITITGSSLNNGTYTVATGGVDHEIVVVEDLVDEAASANVTITAPPHVALGDYGFMDRGATQFVVTNPGPFSEPTLQAGMSYREWQIPFEIFYRFQDYKATTLAVVQMRDAIITQSEKYPTINGTAGIISVRVSSSGNLLKVRNKTDNSGPYYLYQAMLAAITERHDISGGEY